MLKGYFMELQVDKNILKPNSFIDEYNKELLKRIYNNNFDLYYAKDIIIYLLILYKDTGSNFYKTLILKINDEYMKNYKHYTFNNSFWYGHSSYLYILNKMHEYGIIKDGNFNSYKNILLENIRDIVNGNYIQNHRWYDLFITI